MPYLPIILLITYIIAIRLIAGKIVLQSEEKEHEEVLKEEKVFQKLLKNQMILYDEKMDLEAEALKIFTLYEMTEAITKSLTEDAAFTILKEKLSEHVIYKSCYFFDPQSEDIKKYRKMDDFYVFVLRDKKSKTGYLAVEGLSETDKEKVMILGHQFALALRRVKLYKEIEKIAITDSLTGVHTRRYALERFQEEIRRSLAHKIKMSFLMIDVDYFKKFNDKYGHLTGDKVLRSVGKIIRNNIREIDIAGRYGGEEFCVVLPDTDSEGAKYAAERIRSAAYVAVVQAYDTKLKVTVSIGVSTYPQDGKVHNDLIDKADIALYQAKKEGRNKVCFFDNKSK
ncbi:MAG: GGDEF domain-containing protein [Candidatus Omnitrophica bacterium]|nr:GGDEF domain-containing protein [Candidatus Omnitrophota bacterium]MBU1996241.1 GGDEF domain-containing protein [Candidatus Omnitrophota bacterium]MBU4333242.1 GGDEF domain-containing protein [Candidatus Omnitrophota bacterium]